MLKFFATDVSVSKGYDGSPALRFSESDGVSGSASVSASASMTAAARTTIATSTCASRRPATCVSGSER